MTATHAFSPLGLKGFAMLAAVCCLMVAPQSMARNKQQKPLPYCEQGTHRQHNACGAPIVETSEYVLYWGKMTRSPVGLFTPADSCYRTTQFLNAPIAVNLALVFKTTDPDFVVLLDEAYKKRVEKEILPAIAKLGCKDKEYESLYIAHYLETIRISGGTGPIYMDPSVKYPNNMPPGIYVHGEIPLSSIMIQFEKNALRYGTIQSPLGMDVPTSLAKLSVDRENRQAVQAAIARARAEQENRRMEESFAQLREGMKKIGEMMEPVTTMVDQMEQALEEDTGVFYTKDFRSSPARASVTLCNQSKEPMRFASAIEHSPRSRIFDPSIDTEMRVRGWGSLPVGACKTVVTSTGNAAILRIEHVSADKTTPVLYSTDEDASKANLGVIKSRLMYTNKMAMCVKPASNFEIRARTVSDAGQCQDGFVRLMFPYVLQFDNKQRYTLTLK